MMCKIFPVWIWWGTEFQVQQKEGRGRGGQSSGNCREIWQKQGKPAGMHDKYYKKISTGINRQLLGRQFLGKIIVALLHTEISEQVQQGFFFNVNHPWKLEFQNRYSTASSREETPLTSVRCRAWNVDSGLTSCSPCLPHPARLFLGCRSPAWVGEQQTELSQQL